MYNFLIDDTLIFKMDSFDHSYEEMIKTATHFRRALEMMRDHHTIEVYDTDSGRKMIDWRV